MKSIACATLVGVSLVAQSPREFEVASIRPSEEQLDRANVGVHISGAQVHTTGLSLTDYVAMAYEVPVGRVTAPEGLAQARFDISAKVPDGASAAAVPEMMQRLLATRFELKAHREKKEFPVYALLVRKDGLKLKESAPDQPAAPGAPAPGTVNAGGSGSAAGVFLNLGDGSSFTLAANRVEFTRALMSSVATTFSRLMDRPVVDATGLTGRYDLAFTLTPEDYSGVLIRSAINAGVVLPPQALRALEFASNDPFSLPLERFGLTLEPRRMPLDIVIVDSIRRTPTDN